MPISVRLVSRVGSMCPPRSGDTSHYGGGGNQLGGNAPLTLLALTWPLRHSHTTVWCTHMSMRLRHAHSTVSVGEPGYRGPLTGLGTATATTHDGDPGDLVQAGPTRLRVTPSV